MASEVLTQLVGAGATVSFGRGRIFNLLQASSPVTITLEKHGGGGSNTNPRIFKNIPAGSKFTAPKGEEWTYLRLTSVLGQNVTLFVGDDDMSFNNAVTVSGVAVVSVSPNNGLNPSTNLPIANAAAGSVAANPARKSITFSSRAANGGPVYVQSTGAGAGLGTELQPGTYQTWNNLGAFDVRNDSGALVNIGVNEEI
jgi:hypothetical protein